MPVEISEDRVSAALDLYRQMKPVESACASANYTEKKARLVA